MRLMLRPWRRASRRAALPWYLEPDHQSIQAIQSSVALCLPLLLVSQCKLPLTYVWSGPYMGFSCVSTFGLAQLPPRVNLVQAALSSGQGNPIPGPSPLQEESERRGSLAGLEPPLNREYFQCFQCLLGHVQSRRCQVNISLKPARCRAAECVLPYFMPLAKPKLERKLLYESWSNRGGKRYRLRY